MRRQKLAGKKFSHLGAERSSFFTIENSTCRFLSTAQYHFGGFSRRTLMICLGSVMSNQRPYVFHPSATTWTKALPNGASGTWASPSRFVFTLSSSFLSFFNLRSSMYFTYTLAFSTGAPFSPPVTSMVMRVCVSALAEGGSGLDAEAAGSCGQSRYADAHHH